MPNPVTRLTAALEGRYNVEYELGVSRDVCQRFRTGMNIPTVRNGSVDLGAWRSIAPSKKGAAWRRRIVPRSITWKDLLATYGSKPHVRRVDTPDPVTRLNAALEGRYRIERQLDEGGMARVYLAGTAPVAAAMRYSGGPDLSPPTDLRRPVRSPITHDSIEDCP